MGTPLSSQPSWGSLFSFSPSASTPVTPPDLEQQQQRVQHASPIIERFRHGYPRYSALLSSADCFLVLRRFKRLRARVLLRKQDKLTTLEQKLDEIDDDEKMPMFLGTCRHDKNAERERVLAEIEEHLLDYDKFVETTNKTLAYDDARPRDISSLQNWLHGNGCIIKGERAYLDHHRDLFSVVPAVDNAMVNFESWVEDLLISMSWYRETNGNDISQDREVHIYSGLARKRLAMGLLISLVTILLLLPIVICNVITATALRIFIVMLSTVFYLLVLSGLTRAKTTELVVAATTYATVLIVFVSGTGD